MTEEEQSGPLSILVRALNYSAVDELILTSLVKQQYGWLRFLFPFVRHRDSLKRQAYKRILTDVNVCFRAGRFTAIMGASGAGKTTLLSAIVRDCPS
jgi:ABC-type multidrug transport system ATPase subunit